MPTYTVIWSIDIDAESPEEAAKIALDYQRDAESTATVFNVSQDENSSVHFSGGWCEFDLSEKGESSIAEQIKKGMALAFFACAYADQADECEQPLTGEIMDQLPDEIDPSAIHAAAQLTCDLLHKNAMPDLGAVYAVLAEGANSEGADLELTPENFGHYCAMQAMGTGVGLERFGYDARERIDVPYVSFSSCSLQKDYFTMEAEQ